MASAGTWVVLQEHDLSPDTVLAQGFVTQEEAWTWATEYSLYYSKRFRRYAFLRAEERSVTETKIPRIPKLYGKDVRTWWKRLLDR